MVNFPDWVELPKRQAPEDLAAKRLRYLVIRASVEHNFGANIASFSKAIGKERSTVHMYIKNGKFTDSVAMLCEQVFGKKSLRAEWLINPLEIEQK